MKSARKSLPDALKSNLPLGVGNAVDQLSGLPGLGPKSALRAAAVRQEPDTEQVVEKTVPPAPEVDPGAQPVSAVQPS